MNPTIEAQREQQYEFIPNRTYPGADVELEVIWREHWHLEQRAWSIDTLPGDEAAPDCDGIVVHEDLTISCVCRRFGNEAAEEIYGYVGNM